MSDFTTAQEHKKRVGNVRGTFVNAILDVLKSYVDASVYYRFAFVIRKTDNNLDFTALNDAESLKTVTSPIVSNTEVLEESFGHIVERLKKAGWEASIEAASNAESWTLHLYSDSSTKTE